MKDDDRRWIGVDLDGTFAYYGPGATPATWTMAWDEIGPPIMPMVKRVQEWLGDGKEVRIVTARVFPFIPGQGNPLKTLLHTKRCLVTGRFFTIEEMIKTIQKYTMAHVGMALTCTCAKDYKMIELWDDRAVQVVPNTGRTLAEEHAAITSALHGKAQG